MDAKENFTVAVTKKELVRMLLPSQEELLPLSNLDLLLPAVDVGVFFCYTKPEGLGHSMSFGSIVSVLKKAMAEALLSYYALAGEVVINTVGEPQLVCNNRGVDFIEARADVELRNLDFHNPDESIEGKLVPKKKHGVLCVQVSLYLKNQTRYQLLSRTNS
ncbi:hypothetical protein DITRI_Ditri20bG0131800 [Diplodiscus trichospermus]